MLQSKGCATAYGVSICDPPLSVPVIESSYSDAGLYLWVTRADVEDPGAGSRCWTILEEMADLGILVAPGSFYGATGGHHVRVALTATDERIDAAVQRLARRGQGG